MIPTTEIKALWRVPTGDYTNDSYEPNSKDVIRHMSGGRQEGVAI